MSIATQLTALANNRDAIKAAIEAKGVADAGDTLAEFPAAIQSIPSGGGGDEPKTWYGSGTHIWMHFEESYSSHTLSLEISMRVSGTATIDWGDGSAYSRVSASASTQNIKLMHTYADGDYTAHITGYDECEISRLSYSGASQRATLHDFFVQIESDTKQLVGNGNQGYAPIPMCRNLRHVNLTECTTISNTAIGGQASLATFLTPKVTTISAPWFGNTFNVRALDFPKLSSVSGLPFSYLKRCESISIGSAGLATFPNNSLRECQLLRTVVLPDSMTSLGDNFMYGSFLFGGSVKIPEGVTSFSGEALRASNFTKVELPSTLSSFGSSTWAMNGTYALERMIVRATTPPTLPSTNNLSSLLSYCKIYVPYGCGDTYKTATNWSAHAGKIYELNQDGTIPQT